MLGSKKTVREFGSIPKIMLFLCVFVSGCSTMQDYDCESRYQGTNSTFAKERHLSLTLKNGDRLIPLSNVYSFRFVTKNPDKKCNGSFIADVRKVTSINKETHSSRIELRNGKSFIVDSSDGVLPFYEIFSLTHFYNEEKDELYTAFFSPTESDYSVIEVHDSPIPELVQKRFAVYFDDWLDKRRAEELVNKHDADQRKAKLLEARRLQKVKEQHAYSLAQAERKKNEDLMLSLAGIGGLICKKTPLKYEIYYENKTPFGTARVVVPKVASEGQIVATIEQINHESRRIQYRVSSYDANIPRDDLKWINKRLSYNGLFLHRGMLNWDAISGWSPCHYTNSY